jgi:HK97 gp10 family phage protein
MKMKIKGIDDTFKGLSIQLAGAQKKHLLDTSKKMIQELREETPVDTGHARDSWITREEGKSVIVENTTPYLKYLNEGSSKQAPAHFVERVALKYGTPLGAITESINDSTPR